MTAFDEVVSAGEDIVYKMVEVRVVGAEFHSHVDGVVQTIWWISVGIDIEVALNTLRLYTNTIRRKTYVVAVPLSPTPSNHVF